MKRKGNPVAKDLRSPKYRKRIVRSPKHYDRNKTKQLDRKDKDGSK